jgi:hypothetical protein
MTTDERLDRIIAGLDHHEQVLGMYLESFRQSGENFKTIGENFKSIELAMHEERKAIAELRAISEVQHFRIRKLENQEPTAELPQPKKQGAA